MNTSHQNTRDSFVRLFARIRPAAGPARPRDVRVSGEEMFRDHFNKLKRFFDANEMQVGYASEVLAAVSERIDAQGRLTDDAGQSIDDLPGLGAFLLDEARKVLDAALKSETTAQANLMKMFTLRAAARESVPLGRAPGKTAESLYWEWIGRCENFFIMHRTEPARALATVVLRRLARGIDAEGFLRDREGKEVGNLDAYIDQIARNVLMESKRPGAGALVVDPDAGGFVTPEIEAADDVLEEETVRECTSECVHDLRKRQPELVDLLVRYNEASDIRNAEERAERFVELAGQLKRLRDRGASKDAPDAVAMPQKAALNYLRVNVHRTRERLESIYKECIRLCMEKKA